MFVTDALEMHYNDDDDDDDDGCMLYCASRIFVPIHRLAWPAGLVARRRPANSTYGVEWPVDDIYTCPLLLIWPSELLHKWNFCSTHTHMRVHC